MTGPAAETLDAIDRYWRAANYLSVGQIYLLDNPLLREPLGPEHVKPRLLGHFGTTPGLNLIYAHLNRAIRERSLSAIFVTGPGHGGPANVANAYLEGTYSELYPDIAQDVEGMRKLFRQFSFPGGIPSHAAPETPGSIHEGGELGYALSHAFGAAFDNPDLLVACVVGDGEAETGPLAASWHSNKFLSPRVDGAVLPILHLNGYKIANPTVLARIPEDELLDLFRGYGWEPLLVSGGFDGEESRPCARTLRDGAGRRARPHRFDPAGRARRTDRRRRAAGRCSSSVLRRDGQGRARSTGSRSREPGARIRCRSQASARTLSIVLSWRSGCAATGPRSCSTTKDGSCPSSRRSRREATQG